MHVVGVQVERPDLPDGRLCQEVQNVRARAAQSDDCDHIILELGDQIRDLRPGGQRVVELEHRVGRGLLHEAERVGVALWASIAGPEMMAT